MGDSSKLTPNTRLGEVSWWCDEFFGTMLFICQGYLGMGGQKPDEKFLNARYWGFVELLEFFEERELPNGMLAFDLYADRDWHTCILATIETTIPFKEYAEGLMDEQTFFNLIADFKEYVRSLPLCDPSKREGAMWTDEDIERGYSPTAAAVHEEAFRQLDAALLQSVENLKKKTDDDDGGIF